jgi:hypothetical protein
MPAEEASEFEAGIAGRAEHRGFKLGRHQFVPVRLPCQVILEFEAYLSIIMHKYSSILTGLAAVSSQTGNPGARESCGAGQEFPGETRANLAFFVSFSDDCKKKFLLDSMDHRHLV